MNTGYGQVYIGDICNIQSHLIPDDGDRDVSQNVGFFGPCDMANGLRGFY
jgi:hypothetical protein